MVDWQSIAEIAPVLGAGLTGNPQTLQATMQGYGMGQKIKNDQALRSFGRELSLLGTNPDPAQISQLAAKYGIDPITSQALVSTFLNHRKQNEMMRMSQEKINLDKQQHSDIMDFRNRQLTQEKEIEEGRNVRRGVKDISENLKWESEQEATADYRDKVLRLREKDIGKKGDDDSNVVMDNTRGHYNLLISGFKDPNTGGIFPGKEKQYEELMNVYQLDQQLVSSGKKPTWMTGKKVKRTGTTPDGRRVIQYADGSYDVL